LASHISTETTPPQPSPPISLKASFNGLQRSFHLPSDSNSSSNNSISHPLLPLSSKSLASSSTSSSSFYSFQREAALNATGSILTSQIATLAMMKQLHHLELVIHQIYQEENLLHIYLHQCLAKLVKKEKVEMILYFHLNHL